MTARWSVEVKDALVTGRRGYLDWLRGVAVLIMVEAHTLDSWTRLTDRDRRAYEWAIVIAGFAAPIFLFLTGVALALAAGARVMRGRTDAEAASLARKRGWQIFGLAFLFRLQSWVISDGPAQALLKVDVLNVMGVSVFVASLLWGLGRGQSSRTLLLAGAACAAAMLAPVIRATEVLSPLPDPVEWYLRPFPGRTTFTLFPWGGFLMAGAAIGIWLDAARTDSRERIANVAFACIGAVMALGGYAASFLPPVYEQTSFWTSSPTFFFLRLGIVILLLPLAYAWNAHGQRARAAPFSGRSPLRALGVSSLFVYWIHVEMVYGIISTPLHRRLPFEGALIAVGIVVAFLYALVKLKERVDLRGLRGCV